MQEMEKEYCTNGIMYHIGKSNIFIMTPVITDEERNNRLEEIRKLIYHLLYNKEENYN